MIWYGIYLEARNIGAAYYTRPKFLKRLLRGLTSEYKKRRKRGRKGVLHGSSISILQLIESDGLIKETKPRTNEPKCLWQ